METGERKTKDGIRSEGTKRQGKTTPSVETTSLTAMERTHADANHAVRDHAGCRCHPLHDTRGTDCWESRAACRTARNGKNGHRHGKPNRPNARKTNETDANQKRCSEAKDSMTDENFCPWDLRRPY